MKKPRLSENLKSELEQEVKRERKRKIIANCVLLVVVFAFGGLFKTYVLKDSINIANEATRTPAEKIESQPEVKGEKVTTKPLKNEMTTTTTTTTTTKPYTEYQVKEGDTLGEIANANGLTSQELMDYNGITDPTIIRPGQIIKIQR